MPLRNPLIAAASPLSRSLTALQELEFRGAGAVVFHSLFEEASVLNCASRPEYCEKINRAKNKLHIPIIGSLSATTSKGWAELAREIEGAGADALELNIYESRLSTTAPSAVIEDLYIEAVRNVVSAVKIPVSVKLPPFFTSLAYVCKELEEAGARGLVLFNRFYLPDMNLHDFTANHSLKWSSSHENRLSLRWISLLYRPIQADLVANTGIRTGDDALKMILAGAAATEVCGVLLQRGISWLEVLVEELQGALVRAQLKSVSEARGKRSHRYTERPGAIEREEYENALQGYSHFESPAWGEIQEY